MTGPRARGDQRGNLLSQPPLRLTTSLCTVLQGNPIPEPQLLVFKLTLLYLAAQPLLGPFPLPECFSPPKLSKAPALQDPAQISLPLKTSSGLLQSE